MFAIGRTVTGICGVLVGLAVLTGCGGRVDHAASAGNASIVSHLLDLPGAERVDVDQYGYGLEDGRGADDFFTEVRYTADLAPAAAISAVKDGLGEGWAMTDAAGAGPAASATFSKGDARVAITTWDGGFDVMVASRGAELDGTSLAL